MTENKDIGDIKDIYSVDFGDFVDAYIGKEEKERRLKEGWTYQQIVEDITKEIKEEWANYKKNIKKGEDIDEKKEEFIDELADVKTSIFTTEIFLWYAQTNGRFAWANEYLKEIGGCGEEIIDILQGGIILCLKEGINSILENLED